MRFGVKNIALGALLVCAALVLSIFEGFLPAAAIPIPGIKLGLANIVILFALYRLGFGAAACILFCIFNMRRDMRGGYYVSYEKT